MTPTQRAELAQHGRQAWALGIYRWLIGVAFLFAAFTEFPEHKWSIGLGLIVFNAAIEAIVATMQLINAAQNTLMDAGERKTRHTIVMAAERVGQPEVMDYDFWSDIDRRVTAERAEIDDPDSKPPGFWKTGGLVLGNLIWRLVADLFGIGLVASLTS